MATAKRIHEVKSPLPPDAKGESPLILIHVKAREELSQPFEYVVDLLSEKDDIDPNKLLGKPMTLLPTKLCASIGCFACTMSPTLIFLPCLYKGEEIDRLWEPGIVGIMESP